MSFEQPQLESSAKPLLTPRQIVVQVLGWLIGVSLLALIIRGAIAQGDWQKLRHADPRLIAALLGCTVASTLLNGSTFWLTIQPLRPPGSPNAVRWRDMQFLNIVANMLNYAPIRLGAIARVIYHMRVDRLSLVQIGGWFGMIGMILALGIGSCLLATLVRNQLDWIWLAIVLVQMVVGAFVARWLAGLPLIAKHARGVDKLLLNPVGLWGAVVFRLLDLAAYAGRMAAALAILDISLSLSQVALLAIVALAASLMPIGKVGFREYCVAALGARLNLDAAVNQGTWDQLALIESAGEALVFIPIGAVLLIWLRRRLLGSRNHGIVSPLQ